MTFTPTTGIPVEKLALIASALGQNVGAVDDHCAGLGITEAMIDADADAVVGQVNDRLNELEQMMEMC